jgi:hypothetical protein
MENDIKPAFGAAAEVLEGYLSRGIINWGEPVQGTYKEIFISFLIFHKLLLPAWSNKSLVPRYLTWLHILVLINDVGTELVRSIGEKQPKLRTRQF